jgi:DNA-binding NarL/FixJ family response regulator
MFANHMFLAFATLAAWMEAHICYPDPSVILFCSKGRQRGGSDMVNDVESLCRSMAAVPVVVISDIEDGSRIMRMLEKGARGYIPTSMALSVAAEAVRLVEVGGTFAPFSTLKLPCPETDANSSALFTERQIMVVEALRRGKANKQIALELNMRESTVKVHVRRIMKKLNARNRTEVAVMTASMFDEAR